MVTTNRCQYSWINQGNHNNAVLTMEEHPVGRGREKVNQVTFGNDGMGRRDPDAR